MLKFITTNWVNILLVIVGLSAFVIYFWQRRDEKRAAATLVKEQIDLIEERVRTLKNDHQLGNISVYHSKIIIQENLWEKHKHLLVKNLQRADAEAIQRFFDCAEQIEHTRSDIIQTMTHAWEHKSLIAHQIVGELIQAEIEKKVNTHPEIKEEIQIEMKKCEVFQQAYYPLDWV